MAIDRRTFTAGLAATVLSSLSQPSVADTRTVFVTSARNQLDGRFVVVGLSQNFEITWQYPLPSRAHAPVQRSGSDSFAIIARRPDRFVEIRHKSNGEKAHHIDARHGRHFYGHGAFDQTGQYMFLTENNFEHGRGVIGIYDALDRYKRIDEIASGGIGPHEIALMSDGNLFAVANGGIRTHPNHGRTKLNLDDMMPSLQMIDTSTGKLGQTFFFEAENLKMLSIRHIGVMRDGRIIVGCQDQAAPRGIRPLVYITDPNTETLQPLRTPDAVLRRMSGYVGSIAISTDDQLIAASCPHGNIVVLWNTDTLEFQSLARSKDVCGITAALRSDGIVSSNGDGTITMIGREREPGRSASHAFLQWDNHIITI